MINNVIFSNEEILCLCRQQMKQIDIDTINDNNENNNEINPHQNIITSFKCCVPFLKEQELCNILMINKYLSHALGCEVNIAWKGLLLLRYASEAILSKNQVLQACMTWKQVYKNFHILADNNDTDLFCPYCNASALSGVYENHKHTVRSVCSQCHTVIILRTCAFSWADTHQNSRGRWAKCFLCKRCKLRSTFCVRCTRGECETCDKITEFDCLLHSLVPLPAPSY